MSILGRHHLHSVQYGLSHHAFAIAISSPVSYGGLLHFVYYYFTETKCSTALFASIFLPLLLCSGGVFTLSLQKPHMVSQAAKRIPLQSLSVSTLPYTCTHLPHTAVTGYEGTIIKNSRDFSRLHLNCQNNPLNHLLQHSAPYNT